MLRAIGMLITTALGLAAFAASVDAQSVTVDINQGIFRPGDSVVAIVTTPAQTSCDSDLGSTTIAAGVQVQATIGRVPGPGIYQIHLSTGSDPNAYLGILVFSRDAQGKLRLTTANFTGKAVPTPVDKPLLTKFFNAGIKGSTNSIFADAFLTAASNYVRDNPGPVALTAAMALAPGFEEGAVAVAGGIALSVFQDFLKKSIDEELEASLITDGEAAKLRTWLARSDGVLQVVQIVLSGGQGAVQNFFRSVNAALDINKQTDSNARVHGVVGFFDEKVSILIEISKSGR
jgi:hypothetical protein